MARSARGGPLTRPPPQVVRRALDEGYDVRCLVRPRLTPADFLRDWGATTVQGDLNDPASLPAALVGISIVVDCATSKPEEPIRKVDWEAKCALIQCAVAMKVQRYIFFSIDKCDQHREVPLMDLKFCTEAYLAASGLQYTVLRLTGFMQPLISACVAPRRAVCAPADAPPQLRGAHPGGAERVGQQR